MMKHLFIIILLLALFMLTACNNPIKTYPDDNIEITKDLKYYPRFFINNNIFNAVIIIDANASVEDQESAQMLLESYKINNTENIIKKYPIYSDLQKNAILIGSCSQEPKNMFINIYTDCLSMRPEQSIIRIINHKDAWLLFVVGYNESNTRNAINVLINYKNYTLIGQDVEVVKENNQLIVGQVK